jgi:hypothetical protein
MLFRCNFEVTFIRKHYFSCVDIQDILNIMFIDKTLLTVLTAEEIRICFWNY